MKKRILILVPIAVLATSTALTLTTGVNAKSRYNYDCWNSYGEHGYMYRVITGSGEMWYCSAAL